jgi:hypothetical protein
MCENYKRTNLLMKVMNYPTRSLEQKLLELHSTRLQTLGLSGNDKHTSLIRIEAIRSFVIDVPEAPLK